MVKGRVLAVLTGDIVDSSALVDVGLQPISELIEKTGIRVKAHFPNSIHAQVDVFRGDSWQMVVLKPSFAVRIGLYFRAYMQANFGIDSRISIGFGSVDYLPEENISSGMGLAFTLSGQGLEKCQKPVRMNLNFPPSKMILEGEGLNIITQLIDLQAGRWTSSQAQAVAGALTGLTQADSAADWQPDAVSQQAISQHLEKAGWSQIKRALTYLEVAIPVVLR